MLIRYNNLFRNKIQVRKFFNYKDAFLLENQLSEEEKSIKELAHIFSKNLHPEKKVRKNVWVR
jgi:hypothetical protein